MPDNRKALADSVSASARRTGPGGEPLMVLAALALAFIGTIAGAIFLSEFILGFIPMNAVAFGIPCHSLGVTLASWFGGGAIGFVLGIVAFAGIVRLCRR